MKKIGSGYMDFVHNIADEAAEEHRQLRAVNKELLEALCLCTNVLAGHDMSKSALTRALEKSAEAIKKAKGADK